MGYYPVLLDLAGRRCLMVGGGSVAERRVDALLAAGAQVTVISPRVTQPLAALAAEGRIGLESRGYREGDLAGNDLVFVATGGTSPALARAVREELEAYLTAEYATLAAIAAEARREVRAAGRVVTAEAWRRALGPEVRRLIVERGRDDAKHRLLELLGVEACVR